MIREKSTTILLGKNASKSPFISLQSSNLEDIDDQDVSRLCTVDPDWATEHVNHFKVDIRNILRIIIVFNLTIRPVFAFDSESFSWVD